MSIIRDEEGIPIRNGDYITFTFGIPPTTVLCSVTSTGGPLEITCIYPQDVKPKHDTLANVMRSYQVWKASKERVAAYTRDFGGAT